MQIFVRDGRHVAVEAEVDSTVADVKAAYLQKACGGLFIHNEIVSTTRCNTDRVYGMSKSRGHAAELRSIVLLRWQGPRLPAEIVGKAHVWLCMRQM